MGILSTGLTAFRKYVTDGVPASGPNNPSKDDILAFVNACGALDPVPGQIATLQSQVGAATGGHVGFASSAAMIAAVGSYSAGQVAECYDSDPTLAGIYIRGASTWGSKVAELPANARAALDLVERDVVPLISNTGTLQIALVRLSIDDWEVRTPMTNGLPTDYVIWRYRDIGHLNNLGRFLNLVGFGTYEGGIVRMQSDYHLTSSVFEFAFFVGLMTDPLNLWGFYGNGHGNVANPGMFMQMDGGARLENMAIGSAVFGTQLTNQQTFDIKLPKDGTTTIGSILTNHVFDANGCLFAHAHTITAANIGNVNSYSAMMPLTGCDMIQFGANAPFAINKFDLSQSPNQGHQSTIKAWHTERPDLVVELVLTNAGGDPGQPDGWSNDATTDTFVQNQLTYSKAYVNYRSGATAIAAVNSVHQQRWRVRKDATLLGRTALNFAAAVNFASAGDNAIAIKLPAGYTRYLVSSARIDGASANISAATFGLFTAASGGGVAIIPAGTAVTVSSASDATNNNAQTVTPANAATETFLLANDPSLFFRVGTTAAGTANVTITVVPLP